MGILAELFWAVRPPPPYLPENGMWGPRACTGLGAAALSADHCSRTTAYGRQIFLGFTYKCCPQGYSRFDVIWKCYSDKEPAQETFAVFEFMDRTRVERGFFAARGRVRPPGSHFSHSLLTVSVSVGTRHHATWFGRGRLKVG